MEHLVFSQEEKEYFRQHSLKASSKLTNIYQRLENYSKIRKKELQLKVSLASKLKQLAFDIKFFEKFLPQLEEETPDNLERDLRDIQSELAKLSN
jgi:hypothetical protein